MTDFSKARQNMVDSQIHTMGVVNEAVLDAFRTVEREKFVPVSRQGTAYTDEDLAFGNGRWLMEPGTHARLLQFASPLKSEKALDIGGMSGYSAAILSSIVASVVAVESDSTLLEQARSLWAAQGCGNIHPVQGDLKAGCVAHAPYDLIVMGGAVAFIPSDIVSQLAIGGRMVCVVRGRDDKIGKAVLIQRSSPEGFSERILFDAAVPFLPGFEPRREFVF